MSYLSTFYKNTTLFIVQESTNFIWSEFPGLIREKADDHFESVEIPRISSELSSVSYCLWITQVTRNDVFHTTFFLYDYKL